MLPVLLAWSISKQMNWTLEVKTASAGWMQLSNNPTFDGKPECYRVVNMADRSVVSPSELAMTFALHLRKLEEEAATGEPQKRLEARLAALTLHYANLLDAEQSLLRQKEAALLTNYEIQMKTLKDRFAVQKAKLNSRLLSLGNVVQTVATTLEWIDSLPRVQAEMNSAFDVSKEVLEAKEEEVAPQKRAFNFEEKD